MALMYLSMTRWPIKPKGAEQKKRPMGVFNQIRNPVVANAHRKALLQSALCPIP
jgi:hypothetical protein